MAYSLSAKASHALMKPKRLKCAAPLSRLAKARNAADTFDQIAVSLLYVNISGYQQNAGNICHQVSIISTYKRPSLVLKGSEGARACMWNGIILTHASKYWISAPWKLPDLYFLTYIGQKMAYSIGRNMFTDLFAASFSFTAQSIRSLRGSDLTDAWNRRWSVSKYNSPA